MPQMTPGAARVADPVLTQFAIGYQQAGLVAELLFPRVTVGLRAGKVVVFGKEDFMLHASRRAPGANVRRIALAYGNQSYSVQDDSLDAQVPRELVEEAQAGPGINLGMAAVSKVRGAQQTRIEYEAAQLATTAGNFPSGNKATLSGTSQWSDPASNPIAAVETAKEAVRGKIGVRPNTLVVGAAVFAALKTHPVITDRIKYTGRDVATPELLASLFGVARLGVGDAVVADDAGTFSDVWGKYAVLAYTELAGVVDMGRPTFGCTYALAGYPVVEPERWDADTRSWMYGVSEAATPVIASSIAGYLFSAAVA